MTIGSGLAGQVGYISEVTYGTAPGAVDTFLPLVSETLIPEVERLKSAGIRAGRRTMDAQDTRQGVTKIAGNVQHEATDNSIGLLLRHLIGPSVDTGSGPYVHTMTPGALGSFVTQVGKPRADGASVTPFTFDGCKAVGGTLTASRGGVARLGIDIVAQGYTTGTALAAASFGSDDDLFRFVDSAITLGGADIAGTGTISSWAWNITNPHKTDRFDAGSTVIAEPIENGLRQLGGSVTCEFESMTTYQKYLDGTESDLVLTLSNGANSLVITLFCYLGHAGPAVAGPDVIEVTWPFEVIGAGTDADACTVVLTNDDATP